MDPIVVPFILAADIIFVFIAWFFFKQHQADILKVEVEKQSKQLKKQVLELQVLRSLGERAGYSTDVHQIMEVIVDSLPGLMDYAVASFMILGKEGKIVFKVKAAESISHLFVNTIKDDMLQVYSEKIGEKLEAKLVEESITGALVEESAPAVVGSSFNLPIVINSKIAALINISSPKKGLYSQEETAILSTILDQVSTQATKLWQVVENEKRELSAMVASLSDGILMVNSDMEFIVANPAIAKMLSIDSVTNLFDIVAAVGTNADLEGSIKKALAEQVLVQMPEFNLNGRDIQIEVEPVKDQYGYLLGAVVLFHDYTTQKHLEKLRQEFTAMMVHELRTPLTTVTYSTDMLRNDFQKLSEEEVQQNIATIGSTTSQMLALVNELMDIARIDAGKFEIIKKPGDLRSLIDEKVQVFRPLAEEKKLSLTADVASDLPTVAFDYRRISQALDNLISNAIKYTDLGHIDIAVKYGADKVSVSVTDTGDGLNPEDMPKLFSKFEQLGKGKTGERGGTGLGLVVTKGIIEAHGGEVEVHSDGLGKGSTFTFTLPIGEPVN